MNEGMFMALRAEAQEANSLAKQLLEEVRRNNELLNEVRLASNRADERLKTLEAAYVDGFMPAPATAKKPDAFIEAVTQGPPKVPASAVGPMTVETVETVDTGKADAKPTQKKGK